jgi:hypothetical protein
MKHLKNFTLNENTDDELDDAKSELKSKLNELFDKKTSYVSIDDEITGVIKENDIPTLIDSIYNSLVQFVEKIVNEQ